MHPKDAEGIANSVDPEQTAPLGEVWSGSVLFAQTYLSENLGSFRYFILEDYRIDPKYRCRQIWANSRPWRSSLIRVYNVCHFICIIWLHKCMLKPHCSNLNITAILGCPRYSDCYSNLCRNEPQHDKMTVHPAKTQISLGIRPVW